MEKVSSRTLRWPESALREQETNAQERHRSWRFPFGRKNRSSSSSSGRPKTTTTTWNGSGLVSVCLCRSPPRDPTAAVTDALDILHLLSLGSTTGLTPTQREWLHHLKKNKKASLSDSASSVTSDGGGDASTSIDSHDENEIADLVLCCLSNQGVIYIYSPWKLLRPESSGNDDSSNCSSMGDIVDDGMASLLFGGGVWAAIQTSFLPLTQPLATLSLTVPLLKRPPNIATAAAPPAARATSPSSRRVQEAEGDDDGDENHDDDMPSSVPPVAGSASRHDDHGGGEGDGLSSILDASMWNPYTDGASLGFRTRDNTPKLAVCALDFLCIAGTGRRVRTQRFRNKDNDHAETVAARSPTTTITSTAIINPGGPCPGIPSFLGGGHGDSIKTISAFQSPPSVAAPLEAPGASDQHGRGGFVTFVSLRTYSEVRNVYVPFEPLRISPFVWGGMTFLYVIGQANFCAIRMDSSEVETVIQDEAPSLFNSHSTDGAGDDSVVVGAGGSPEKPEIPIRRFQILPLLVPDMDNDELASASVVVGATPFTSPPSMAFVMMQGDRNNEGEISAVQLSLEAICQVPLDSEGVDRIFAGYQPHGSRTGQMTVIRTVHRPGHQARMPLVMDTDEVVASRDLWCHLGQGWCLVAATARIFFVCWEGATSALGAFCKEITMGDSSTNPIDSEYGRAAAILPIDPFRITSGDDFEQADLPFSQPMTKPVTEIVDIGGVLGEGVEKDPTSGVMDDVVVNAMESISSFTFNRDTNASIIAPVSPGGRRLTSFSHREKSIRLLRQCSSWMRLEQSNEARSRFGLNQPVISFHAMGLSSTLSLRRTVIKNEKASPFHQVLAWLCDDRGDFFTAASLALDLLRDGSSLRHLWMAFEKIDVDDDASKLEGLLDGIIPIHCEKKGTLSPLRSTLTQLANMTVGCLTKGGYAMSGTLDHFVSHDRHYDPARASLMLVAAVACTLSDDDEIAQKGMGQSYRKTSNHGLNIMWPVRCLLQVGVSRDSLATALLLLNVTVPDELRRRKRGPQSSASARLSMEMCKTLVSLIVASSPEASELLLGLVDEQSRVPYWESLDHETQLELALVGINNRYPMLRQPEIRTWALEQLQDCLQAEGSASSIHVYENTPTAWLQQLTFAILCNGGCNLDGLRKDIVACEKEGKEDDALALESYRQQILRVNGALISSPGSGGVDFDIVIEALLILQLRGEKWRDDSDVPSQSLLNGACNVAGRRSMEEPLFALDGSMLMSQCFLAGNVQAGANLVGGQNGFVLECCDILIRDADMQMGEAEDFLLSDSMPPKGSISSRPAASSGDSRTKRSFEINEGYLHVLWLLEQHVLSIQKYGDFSSTVRGKVDPVFAARLSLRTWWRLSSSLSSNDDATSWLVDWLQKRLEISNDSASPHRLACSALLRALIYSSRDSSGSRHPNINNNNNNADDPDSFLAAYLNLPNHFLVQLAQSCCGLVEAIQLNASDTEASMFANNFYDDDPLLQASKAIDLN